MSPDPKPLIEIGELLLDSLQKTAADLDQKVVEITQMKSEINQLKQASQRPDLDPGDLTKLAHRLHEEGLLREGMNHSQAVAQLTHNPGMLVKLAYSLLAPQTEGRQVRLTKQSFERDSDLVEFNGRMFRDPDGMLAAIE